MIPKRQSTLKYSLPILTVGGVCEYSRGHTNFNWPVSPAHCSTEDYIYYVENVAPTLEDSVVFYDSLVSTLCSDQTESALLQQDCINTVFTLPDAAQSTILYMVRSMCRPEVDDNFKTLPLHPCASECITVLTTSGAAIFEDPVNCLSDCPETVYSNTNTISSPNYPDNYPNYAHLYYVLTAQPGQTIEITFTDIEISHNTRCRDDWVVIVDGDGTELLPKCTESPYSHQQVLPVSIQL